MTRALYRVWETKALTDHEFGAWFSSKGVGTAMTNTSAGAISVEARRLPRATTPETKPSRSTSSICTLPELTVSTTD